MPAVGNCISMDEGFKNASKIHNPSHERVVECTLVVQNGRWEIMGAWHGSSGLRSFIRPLVLMNERSRRLGYPVGAA